MYGDCTPSPPTSALKSSAYEYSVTNKYIGGQSTDIIISPNPATSTVTFESEAYNPIQAIELYDMSGRMVLQQREINRSQYQLERGNLSNGMYIAKVKFEGGILSKKIVFEKQ